MRVDTTVVETNIQHPRRSPKRNFAPGSS